MLKEGQDDSYRTLAQHYEQFAECHVPADAPSYQRRDMKRAFYAGSSVILLEILALSDLDDTEEGARRYSAIERELAEFAHEMELESLLHALFMGFAFVRH